MDRCVYSASILVLTRCDAVVDGRGGGAAGRVDGCDPHACLRSAATPTRRAAAELVDLLRQYEPQVVAVEQVFFQVNVRTAMSVGQASGLALCEAAAAGCEVVQYTPNQVKDAVAGYGAADKRQMQRMVQARLGSSPGCRSRRTPPTPPLSALSHLSMAPSPSVPCRSPRRPMIGSLRGQVLERDLAGWVLVEVSGVGYVVHVTPRALAEPRAVVAGLPLRPPPHPRGRPAAVRVPPATSAPRSRR